MLRQTWFPKNYNDGCGNDEFAVGVRECDRALRIPNLYREHPLEGFPFELKCGNDILDL